MVPLTGGTFTGPELNGKLLPGSSADWQTVSPASPVQRARPPRVIRVCGCSAAPDPLKDGQRGELVAGPAASPACPVQRARLPRSARVSGCSAPRTRSSTGSSAAYWSRAPAASPASPVQVAGPGYRYGL
ncbi:MAG TPA: DUF3237 family protein [Streptosporangiaceae bacterium]